MVRKNHNSKRILRSAEFGPEKRPKRVVQSKVSDDAVGLSRQEEQELNRALYASLHETRRTKSLPDLALPAVNRGSFKFDKPSTSRSEKVSLGKRRSLRGGTPLPKRLFRRESTGSSENDNFNGDESSKDSVKSSSSSINGSKSFFHRKIHAQRKFAQGCSLPGTPISSPTKASSTPVKLLSRTPKTEDFLTFLCLRGTPALPPHLDFFNFSKEELPLREYSPKTTLSGRKKRHNELCQDECSSTSSTLNEEYLTHHKQPGFTEKYKASSPLKKSPRAGVSNLDSPRSIASLRHGSHRKVSPSGAFTPVRSPTSSSRLGSKSPHRKSGADSSEKRHGHMATVDVLKSARKNLLGKLSTAAKQVEKESKKIKGKSLQSVSRSTLRKQNQNKSLSLRIRRLRSGLRERSLRNDKDYEDNEEDSNDRQEEIRSDRSKVNLRNNRNKRIKNIRKRSSERGRMYKSKPERRSSERLKQLLTTPHTRRRRLISEDEEDEGFGERKKRVRGDRVEKTGGMIENVKTSSNSSSPSLSPLANQNNLDKGGSKRIKISGRNKSLKRKTRKPYKIRPPERVRTRGYSLMLASKMALKKAKSLDTNGAAKNRRKDIQINKNQETDEAIVDEKKLKTNQVKLLKNLPEVNVSCSYSKGKKMASELPEDEEQSVIHQPCQETKESDVPLDKKVKKVTGRSTTPSPKTTQVKKVKSTAPSSSRSSLSSLSLSSSSSSSSSISSSSSLSSSSKESLLLPKTVQQQIPLSSSVSPTKSSSSTKPSSKSSRSSSLSLPESSVDVTSEDSIPTFHPSESEFADPLAYIAHIQSRAENFGICKIIPPSCWKLDSSKLNEDIRFTPQVQHVHRLFSRWGSNVQRTAAINYHLLSQLSGNTAPPQIGGVEIDLPQLYSLVEDAGGLSKMADKKHWANIADVMNIPKQAMDRTMRLYDIYCRHVLPYATLSAREQGDLEEEVKAIHELQTMEDEAITRGKSMALSCFNKIARNVQSMWFKEEPTPQQVEHEYWRIVEEREKHVCVQCGHINTYTQASAFPTRKDNPYSKHPWNLNCLPYHQDCVLKYLGPVAGTTIPTMHLGMLFSTSCWSNDPHGLPYIQYHHTGADVIWYCISQSQQSKFRSAMMEQASSLISNNPRWLREDCVMLNPSVLRERGLKVSKCIQSPRQFVVVFPGAYTATISCGFSLSESVHYATTKWLSSGIDSATALTKSGERELFSMSCLLCRLAQDKDVSFNMLNQALPLLSSIISKELDIRAQLHAAGLRSDKRMSNPDSPGHSLTNGEGSVNKKKSIPDEEKMCEICSRICHLSMVYVEQEEQILCLEHGLKLINKRRNTKAVRLFVLYNQHELESMLKAAKDRLTSLGSPKSSSPSSPTIGVTKTRASTIK